MEQITAQAASIAAAVRTVLERARAAGSEDTGALEAVREAIIAVGRAQQGLHGMLLSLVGEGDRLGIARGGIGPWLATVLDVTEGRARSLLVFLSWRGFDPVHDVHTGDMSFP